MVSQNYKRVSRKRVCRICGKSDWCSYTPDEKISFCAREISGADRTSRTGWGVFYHEKMLFPNHIEPPFAPHNKQRPKLQLAPIEIRDFVYRKLITLAPATDSSEIISGEKGLLARKILDFENYGALPPTQSDRREIAKIVRNSINRKFPDYVRQQKSALGGLPGFWIDQNGKAQLWTEKNYTCSLLLIPHRDEKAHIQACQIRFMRSAAFEKGIRYVWLSTPDKNGGLSCGSPLHFARYENGSLKKPVLITEGALKAETTKVFKTEYDVLASAGVGCSHEEIISAARFRPFLLAFDSDCYENPLVARAAARLIGSLLTDSVLMGFKPRIKFLTWKTNFKGIDDALLQNAAISFLSPSVWFKSLDSTCQNQIELDSSLAVSIFASNKILQKEFNGLDSFTAR